MKISDCCESKIIYTDICSNCKEHCESIKQNKIGKSND